MSNVNKNISLQNNTSQSKILHLLKTRGELTSGELAKQLSITAMGARQHMQQLQEKGLLDHRFVNLGKGRPKQKWFLTSNGHAQFPDNHSTLIVNLLDHMKKELGDQKLDQVIQLREKDMLENYQQQLSSLKTLSERLTKLAEIRSHEGYMSEVIKEKNEWYFIENHCPICAAATQCQQFCRSELSIFQQVLQCHVERTEYILTGARRCAYRITQ